MFHGWWYRPNGRPLNVFLRSIPYTDCTFSLLYQPGREWPFAIHACVTSQLSYELTRRIKQMSNLIRHLVKAKKADTGMSIEADDEWLRNLAPTVHELLTTSLKDEGTVYEPAGLFLFASQGTWCASLSNRKLRFKRRAEGHTIEEAIRQLESKMFGAEGEGGAGRSRPRKGAASERNGS